MSIEALIELARQARGRKGRFMRHAKLVEPWWPKPRIHKQPEKYWGKAENHPNSGCRHIYRCESHSAIGFVTHMPNPKEGGPKQLCLAYGETPEHAYDRWCEIFNVWNKKGDWEQSALSSNAR